MIAVVHLVWGPLGAAPLRAFMSSYREHPAAAEHELVVVFNDVSPQQRPELLSELEDVQHRLLELEQPVQDLTAYARAVERLEHDHVCFMNSFSAVLADGWLAKLADGLRSPGVGLVGATGSWQSVRSAALSTMLLPSPYNGVLPARSVAREQFIAIERERADAALRLGLERPGEKRTSSALAQPLRRSRLGSVAAVLKTLPSIPEQLLRFPGFPAPHIRTNAFMVARSTFAKLRIGPVRRKMDAWVLESGKDNLTRQVQRLGLKVLVVDRCGDCHEVDRWHLSATFWQRDQGELLVADNQTRIYAHGSLERRRLLSAFAWGAQAAPYPPAEGAATVCDGAR